jgi:hypothetical protein
LMQEKGIEILFGRFSFAELAVHVVVIHIGFTQPIRSSTLNLNSGKALAAISPP